MLREDFSIDSVLEFLNELAQIDNETITTLVSTRIKCNPGLVVHQTVQASDGEVGLLGILNGLFGTFEDGPKTGWGPISAIIEPDGSIYKFIRTENE